VWRSPAPLSFKVSDKRLAENTRLLVASLGFDGVSSREAKAVAAGVAKVRVVLECRRRHSYGHRPTLGPGARVSACCVGVRAHGRATAAWRFGLGLFWIPRGSWWWTLAGLAVRFAHLSCFSRSLPLQLIHRR
jgi:hypothetical protein